MQLTLSQNIKKTKPNTFKTYHQDNGYGESNIWKILIDFGELVGFFKMMVAARRELRANLRRFNILIGKLILSFSIWLVKKGLV